MNNDTKTIMVRAGYVLSTLLGKRNTLGGIPGKGDGRRAGPLVGRDGP